MQSNFKKNTPISQRKEFLEYYSKKHPEKILIILEKDPKSNFTISGRELKNKYLIPKDYTISQFNSFIRDSIKLNKDSALYFW